MFSLNWYKSLGSAFKGEDTIKLNMDSEVSTVHFI